VTAIASEPQANIEFCTKVLGLRLIKETVNFDDQNTYHFYYGDDAGRPGTILTYFPIVMSAGGHTGTGMVETTTFAVPENSLERWMMRLTEQAIEFDGPFERFSHLVIAFRDPDGLGLELEAFGAPGTADAPDAIRGLDAVTLCVEAPDRTVRLLTETSAIARRLKAPAASASAPPANQRLRLEELSTSCSSLRPNAISGAAAPSTTSLSGRAATRSRRSGVSKSSRSASMSRRFLIVGISGRSIFASRVGSCSRLQPTRRVLGLTRRPVSSARRSSCRPGSSRRAPTSNAGCRLSDCHAPNRESVARVGAPPRFIEASG
jgi:catechol 2,3-dioxygenase-like lactoylglutathione lyase family enzyme